MSDTLRLDAAMVSRGLCTGRDRANELIRAGRVQVNGIIQKKPSFSVTDTDPITLADADALFVSRAGDKLERAMRCFSLEIAGKTALDIGASTGGFTDCMLRRGAAKVFAVDVGTGQLAEALRQDPRVVNLEQTDARTLTPALLGCLPDFCTADVSFISLAGLLAHIHGVLAPGAMMVGLVKPQFEAGKAALSKNGVVKDPRIHARVLSDFVQAAGAAGFALEGLTWSPVRGPAGNIEFLACLRRVESPQAVTLDRQTALQLAREAAERTKA